mgnify:CR=1 FL=1
MPWDEQKSSNWQLKFAKTNMTRVKIINAAKTIPIPIANFWNVFLGVLKINSQSPYDNVPKFSTKSDVWTYVFGLVWPDRDSYSTTEDTIVEN